MASEGLNKAILIGNLGQDPEVRFTQGGQAILNLRMATAESWFDKETQERKERVEWHTVTMWGKRGEALGKILSKGSKLCVEGRIQTRAWEDKQGNKRYSTEVNAANIILLGGGPGREQSGSQHNDGPPPGEGYQSGGGGGLGDDSEIPF